MSKDEEMTTDERRKHVRMVKAGYTEAGRSGKVRLLDEMEAVTGSTESS